MNSHLLFKVIVPKVKKILGIKDIALWRKRWVKRIGKLLYHKKYTAQDIIEIMKEMGMKQGSVVCIHSSMMQFYNYKGTAQDLIKGILEEIGEDGTLMMPALPDRNGKEFDEFIFDPKNDKTVTGYMAETFRKMPGVLRSNNAQHSVCVIGKHAQYLIQDHTKGLDCWDETSPWYRMTQLNGLVFNLGMPHNYMGTFHHCVESRLKNEHPYWSQFFTQRQTFRYIDENGKIVSYNGVMLGDIIRKTREKKVFRHFDESDWQIRKISNLEIKVFYSKNALHKMVDLGRMGISVYYLPSPKKYKF